MSNVWEREADVLRFLSRIALVLVLAGIALMVVLFGIVGVAESDRAAGERFAELLQAARNPTGYQLAMALDASSWLLIGGLLLAFSRILRDPRPIRATLIAACAIG